MFEKLLRVIRMNESLKKNLKKVLLMPKVKKGFFRVLRFYDSHDASVIGKLTIEYLGMQDALTEGDSEALKNLVNMVIKNKPLNNPLILEVGSWKGMSTSILAKAVVNYNGKVFAVDHWMGNEETWNYEIAKVNDIYSIFKRNMIILGIWDIVYPLVMDSETASEIFANEILDLIFLDGDHRYSYIKKDISIWLPKLKKRGILCGHDCEGYYSDYPEEIKRKINENLETDYIPGVCHPGVIKALYESFGKSYTIIQNSVVWYYIRKDSDLTS